MSSVEVDRFACIGEDDGLAYTVVVFQHQTPHRPLRGSARDLGGALEWFLDDGRDLDAEDGPESERLQILETDQWIRKV